jgi:hypothetical protein
MADSAVFPGADRVLDPGLDPVRGVDVGGLPRASPWCWRAGSWPTGSTASRRRPRTGSAGRRDGAARGRLSGAYSAVRGPLQTSTSVADSTRSRERSPSARRSATRIASGHTRDTVTGPFRCAPRGRRLAAAYSWSRKSAVIGSAHMGPARDIHIRTDCCGTRRVGPACTDTI